MFPNILQDLAAAATTVPEPEPEMSEWKKHALKKGPKMVKPDTFSGRMDEMESFVNSALRSGPSNLERTEDRTKP